MRRLAATSARALVSLLPLLLLFAAPVAASHEDGGAALVGRVFGGSKPQGETSVYAYEVASRKLEKVSTNDAGEYAFGTLPSGLYKVIAFKQGFMPAIELLLRRTSEMRQRLELEMVEEKVGDVRAAEDYWQVRGRLPADVLRDIAAPGFAETTPWAPADGSLESGRFEAKMAALGGVEQLGQNLGEAQVTRAQIGVTGALGEVEVEVEGRYEQMTPKPGAEQAVPIPAGEARSVSVELNPSKDSRLSVVGSSGELASVEDGEIAPVGIDHYRVGWSGRTGRDGRSGVTAQYTQESKYYQPSWMGSSLVPDASRTWRIEGFYARDLGTHTSLRTGALYRQRQGRLFEPSELPPLGSELDVDAFDEETLGLYSIADSRIQPRVLVEYGLFSSLRDGDLSLMPHGGVVVELGGGWRARAAASKRVLAAEENEGERHAYRAFSSAFYGDDTTCQEVGESCYEVRFSRDLEDGSSVSLGAVHREYAETLRLYFSPDFFNRLESLLMVRGDSLPELQLEVVRRITPRILAKLESSFGSGGGGVLYATAGEMPYENQVRYLVTSLDTRFQRTSTGVFISFQHLEQSLENEVEPGPELELQRLQLMLTQDLSILADLASNWAVSLNMELSRGSNPYTLTPDDETRKKLTGGFSVTF